jgi:ribosomal subunit interface protein
MEKGEAMQPRISVRNAKVSDETKEHISKVCTKLQQFYNRIIDCEVVVEKSKVGIGVELIVKVPHQTLTASSCDENLYKALSEAQDRLEAQLKKYHDKLVAYR